MKLYPLTLLLVVFLFIFNNRLYAQSTRTNYFIPTFYPKGPNTASIEKFGSYEVNLFTGLPDISIPLYTIDAGDVKVPISLSYHASGIRVQEVASWVGLGWALSAGGTISRKIVGGPDDKSGGYLQGNLRTASSITSRKNNNFTIDSLFDSWITGNIEARPDIFSYSFPGHSGKFFFDGNNGFKPAMIPFSPINVLYTTNGAGATAGIDKFTINDESGNNLVFGDQYIEPTYSGSSSKSSSPSNTGWPLERIITQTKRDTINFTYTNQLVYNPDASSYSDNFEDNISGTYTGYTYGFKPGSNVGTTSSVNEQLLQHIYFKNGRIDFELSSNPRTDVVNNTAKYLNDIVIYHLNPTTHAMEQLKKIVFYDSYFSGDGSTQRLRLDSIQTLDNVNVLKEHYIFTYNTAQLPSYYSNAQDYWGYYNGKTANTSLTPAMTIQGRQGSESLTASIGNANRNTDPNYNQVGMLTSIKYPTGGHTDFVYEANQYYDDSNTLQYAGGLRIASISSYDGINTAPMVKSYQYNSARNNFILNNTFFVYFQNRQHWVLSQASQANYQIDGTETYRNFVSNSRIELEAFDAATVVYPTVTEFYGTASANTGKTVYTFRDRSDVLDIASQTGVPVVNSSFYLRGQLLGKTDFKIKSDGSYQPVKSSSNTYTAFPLKRYNQVGLIVGQNLINEGAITRFYSNYGVDPIQYNGFAISNYDIVSDDNYLTSTTENDYDINDPTKYTTSTTNYAYANVVHQQPTTETHTDSRGGLYTKSYKYAADYLPSGYMTGTTGNYTLDIMLQNNMQAVPIEKFVNFSNPATSVNGVISGELYSYTTGKGNGNAVLPDKVSSLKVAASLTNFTPSTVSSGQVQADSRYIQTISFDDYDNNNDLTKYTPRNASATKVFWDYNRSEPVAKFQNLAATTQSANVAYTSFETANYGNWNVNGSATVANYAPTGMAYYNLSSGTITSPALDNSQAYIVSYWSNGGPATVATGSNYPGTALKSALGWTYYEHQIPAGSGALTLSGSVAIDELRLYPVVSQVTTYTYSPLIGITSMTDAKGMTTYYEYDGYQRLLNVKDKDGNIVKHNEYRYVNQ